MHGHSPPHRIGYHGDFTTSAAHNFCLGQTVTIANVTPNGYIGTYNITGVPSTTTFTCTLAATQTAGPRSERLPARGIWL